MGRGIQIAEYQRNNSVLEVITESNDKPNFGVWYSKYFEEFMGMSRCESMSGGLSAHAVMIQSRGDIRPSV